MNKEKNIMLPTKIIMKLLTELNLKIYCHKDGHKCHYKDVATELTKSFLIENFKEFPKDLEQDPKLIAEWGNRFPDLLKVPVLKNSRSG